MNRRGCDTKDAEDPGAEGTGCGRRTKDHQGAPGGEVDRLLDEAEDAPLLLERNGARFRLSKEPDDDIWAGYDPEKFRKALEETAGSWADLDTEALIERVYRWREEGSRPADRL